MSTHITVENVTFRYPSATRTALASVSCEFLPGQITTVLGESGSGKSTLLGVLAGLLRPDDGAVALDGVDVDGSSPAERGVGLVLQRPYLFPYLDIRDNVAFGLSTRRVRRRERRALAEGWLDRVGLGGYGGRRPSEISGGQQQRVALARALAIGPRVLLLDEPFANLDPHIREGMADLLTDLVGEEGPTTVMVTHDVREAMTVGMSTVLLDDGRLVGAGPSRRIFERPPTRAAAESLGVVTFVTGRCAGRTLATAGFELHLDDPPRPGSSRTVAIRPEHIRLRSSPDDNTVTATVTAVRYRGEYWEVDAHTDCCVLRARSSEPLPVGAPCFMHLPSDRLFAVEDADADRWSHTT